MIIENPDYKNATNFEYALNHGEDVEDAIVRFTVIKYVPNAGIGYPNIWGGNHLNFLSTGRPDVSEGDTVTIRVCDAERAGEHWYISYELLDVESN